MAARIIGAMNTAMGRAGKLLSEDRNGKGIVRPLIDETIPHAGKTSIL